MAQPVSHSQAPSSTDSPALIDLERRFRLNRQHVAALRALADDLEKHPAGGASDQACMLPVFDVLLHGPEAELSQADLRYLAAIGVPPELVRGDTRNR